MRLVSVAALLALVVVAVGCASGSSGGPEAAEEYHVEPAPSPNGEAIWAARMAVWSEGLNETMASLEVASTVYGRLAFSKNRATRRMRSGSFLARSRSCARAGRRWRGRLVRRDATAACARFTGRPGTLVPGMSGPVTRSPSISRPRGP